MQYQAYPTSQSRKKWLRLHIPKSSKKWLSLGPWCPNGRQNSQISVPTYFFVNWTIPSHFEQKIFFRKNRRKMTKSGSQCKGKSQKFRKRSSNIDFNHLFSRIERFWAFPKKIFLDHSKIFKNRTSPQKKIF